MLLWDAGLTVGPQLPLAARVRGDGARGPALADGAHRGAAGDRQRGAVPGAARGDGRPAAPTAARARRSSSAMRREYEERQAKHEGAVCVQEPNVKEGKGGLRELHSVLWVAHARLGARGLAGLEAARLDLGARAQGRAPRLRLPAARAQRGPLRTAAARPTCSRSTCRTTLGRRPRATRRATGCSPPSSSCATTTAAPRSSRSSRAAS